MGVTDLERVIRDAMTDAAVRFSVSGDPRLHDGFRMEISDALMSIWDETVKGSAREVVEGLKTDCFAHLETKQDEESLYDRIVQEFIERYGARKITQIVEATAEQFRRLISIGMRDGMSVAQIADMIVERIPGIAKLRANIIARTETHGAAQFASQRAAEESRLPLMKKWNSTHDHRTRDFGEADGVVDAFSHRAMDGVKVRLDEPFMVPSKSGIPEAMMFPGDPNGSAANQINCRCAQSYERAM